MVQVLVLVSSEWLIWLETVGRTIGKMRMMKISAAMIPASVFMMCSCSFATEKKWRGRCGLMPSSRKGRLVLVLLYRDDHRLTEAEVRDDGDDDQHDEEQGHEVCDGARARRSTHGGKRRVGRALNRGDEREANHDDQHDDENVMDRDVSFIKLRGDALGGAVGLHGLGSSPQLPEGR